MSPLLHEYHAPPAPPPIPPRDADVVADFLKRHYWVSSVEFFRVQPDFEKGIKGGYYVRVKPFIAGDLQRQVFRLIRERDKYPKKHPRYLELAQRVWTLTRSFDLGFFPQVLAAVQRSDQACFSQIGWLDRKAQSVQRLVCVAQSAQEKRDDYLRGLWHG